MAHSTLSQVSTAPQGGWHVEPPADAGDRVGLTKRINWLVAQVQGIDAQLTERRAASDQDWRARAINARNYRLAELRERRLQRSQIVNQSPQMRALLERMLRLAEDVAESAFDFDEDELALLEEVKGCLQ